MLFAIHDCGFIARTALEDTGSNEMRIEKIVRIIAESCYSIHDISRVEVSRAQPRLPRFNMPFECGLAMGAIRYGAVRRNAPERDFLLMAAVPFQDKQTLSDLAGQDPKVHHNEPAQVIAAVRAFLSAKVKPPMRTRGAEAIRVRYARFQERLPALSKALEGGEQAPLSAETTVRGMIGVLEHAGLEQSGRFFQYDSRKTPR